MVQYVGPVPEDRIENLSYDIGDGTREVVIDFLAALQACGLVGAAGVARPILPPSGGAPGLAYYRILSTRARGSDRWGTGVKPLSVEPQGSNAGTRPERVGASKASLGRDRLGDEIRKCIVPRSGAPKAHT